MSNIDFSKFQSLDLLNLKFPTPDYSIPHSVIEDMNRRNEETMRSIQEAREERDAEELRRHNELVAAIREAAENGATIVIGDNANGVQIQQNSPCSSQTMDNRQGLDFEQVKNILEEIKGYFDYPQFAGTFGNNADNVKSIVEETLKATGDKQNEGLIKKSLRVLRDLAIGASGSLIASGILALLGTISF